MPQTLTLPDELYRKLAQGAAKQGVSVESLLTFVSDLFVNPENPTPREQERSQRIEHLFGKFRQGALTEDDRVQLEHLVDLDYQEAIARADRLIAEKKSRTTKRLRK